MFCLQPPRATPMMPHNWLCRLFPVHYWPSEWWRVIQRDDHVQSSRSPKWDEITTVHFFYSFFGLLTVFLSAHSSSFRILAVSRNLHSSLNVCVGSGFLIIFSYSLCLKLQSLAENSPEPLSLCSLTKSLQLVLLLLWVPHIIVLAVDPHSAIVVPNSQVLHCCFWKFHNTFFDFPNCAQFI